MSNGRSFSRNRKGAPGKSRRRAHTRLLAQKRAEAHVQGAVASILESDATKEALQKAAASLSAASGGAITPDEAEDALQSVNNAYRGPESA